MINVCAIILQTKFKSHIKTVTQKLILLYPGDIGMVQYSRITIYMRPHELKTRTKVSVDTQMDFDKF